MCRGPSRRTRSPITTLTPLALSRYDRAMAQHTVFRKNKEAAQKKVRAPLPPPPPAPADAAPTGVAAQWMHIEHVAAKMWDMNPRDNDPAVPGVVASIKEFGFPTALVMHPEPEMLVVGHTRTKAMLRLLEADPAFTLEGAPGPGYVPVRFHRFKSLAHAKAYALADNRLGETAGWDSQKLHAVAHEIVEELGMGELTIAGFDDDEVATILSGDDIPQGDEDAPRDGPPGPPNPAPPSSPGSTRTETSARIVQLLYPEGEYGEVNALLAELMKRYGVTEQAEVVLRALRAAREAP